jgi:hypothetical protein
MDWKSDQSTSKRDLGSICAKQEEKSKHIDARASSQRLRSEEIAKSQSFTGITSDSHPSASGKEKALPSRDQASDTEQSLRASMKQVGAASTKGLVKRVFEAGKQPSQGENQLRKARSFTFGLSNPNRDIGSQNQTASSSADWAKKAQEAIVDKSAASQRIEQLQREKLNLTKDLQVKKNKFDHKKINIEIKKLEGQIKLEQLKQRNALIKSKSFQIVSEAAKNRELKK